MYGHMNTKFPGMGRFTYPWCSVGACFVHARALLLVKRKCKKRKKNEAFKDDDDEVQDKINVSRVEDVLTNYSLCDERRNHGRDSSCNGNLSIQVVTVFALEPQLR